MSSIVTVARDRFAPLARGTTAMRARLGGRLPAASVLKLVAAGVGVGALVGLGFFAVSRFEFVTVTQGIDTTLGNSQNQTILISKAETANRTDLIVAIRPGTEGTEEEELILGWVFSENDETYALYDGEVIWQIPLSSLRGIVMFAESTETL